MADLSQMEENYKLIRQGMDTGWTLFWAINGLYHSVTVFCVADEKSGAIMILVYFWFRIYFLYLI
jgi:hypothetical protein